MYFYGDGTWVVRVLCYVHKDAGTTTVVARISVPVLRWYQLSCHYTRPALIQDTKMAFHLNNLIHTALVQDPCLFETPSLLNQH